MTRTNKPNKKPTTKTSPVRKEKQVAYLNPESIKPSNITKPKSAVNRKRFSNSIDKEAAKNLIVEMVEADSYTIEEMCMAAGISGQTYYDWKEKDPVFVENLKKAAIKGRMNFAVMAKNSLRRLIEGFEATDVTVAEKLGRKGEIITTTTKTTKIYKPDIAAVIFTLTNVDPDNWKNRQNVSGEITNTNVVTFEDLEETMKDLSDEQLNALKDIALTVKKLKSE